MLSNKGATRAAKLRGYMASKSFALGFADVRNGHPFRELEDTREAWRYERGRHFACIYKGPLKVDRRVTYDAIEAAVYAKRQNWTI